MLEAYQQACLWGGGVVPALRVRAARKLPLKISLVQNMPQKAQSHCLAWFLAVWHEAVVQTTIQANLVLAES